MRYLLAYMRLVLLLLLLAITLAFVITRSRFVKHSEEFGFRVRRFFCRKAQRILGLNLEQIGHVPTQGGLVVANHRSFSDPLILLHALPSYVIAKKEVKETPMLGTGASLTGTVFVNREDKDSRAAVRETIGDILSDGKQVLIFPEGTTNVKMFSSSFRKGSIEQAISQGKPIYPVTVEYSDIRNYWGNGSMRSHFVHQFGRWSTKCYVRFHKGFVSQDLNSALRRIQILIDGDIASYHGYDDHNPRPILTSADTR